VILASSDQVQDTGSISAIPLLSEEEVCRFSSHRWDAERTIGLYHEDRDVGTKENTIDEYNY
jgi:hypothetical protein